MLDGRRSVLRSIPSPSPPVDAPQHGRLHRGDDRNPEDSSQTREVTEDGPFPGLHFHLCSPGAQLDIRGFGGHR